MPEHDAEVTSAPGEIEARSATFLQRMRSVMPRRTAPGSPSVKPPCGRTGTCDLAQDEAFHSGYLSVTDSVSTCASVNARDSEGSGHHSSSISAQGTPRWRAAAAQVRVRGQGALAAGREKVALGREKGRMLLASVSGGAGGALSFLKRVKQVSVRAGSGRRSLDCEDEASVVRDARRRLLGRWGGRVAT